MGTNVFNGEISFITQALSAVLQLGVTMDYSIFPVATAYQEELEKNDNRNDAMANAIAATFKVCCRKFNYIDRRLFWALCFMTFTLGTDLGIVMAKGVIFGVCRMRYHFAEHDTYL
ncbi:MMPL family transporter [Butyrivibrio sp. AE3003]|uniref:MMPL family transporter n=1 Tax=Butyrivibrio sp. AE3003 TaxID=1496721 RepID=UPI000479BA55|nr:MMPL family transporter [Butyrivibrio sp. AE3003]